MTGPMSRALARIRPWLWGGTALLAAYVSVYLAVLKTKPLYAPDTRYYAAMALWFSGLSKDRAAELVATYPGGSAWVTPPVDQLFGWGLVQPRVVYPALSVPFVKVWGIDGMAVVPALATLALVALMAVMVQRRYGWGPALVTSTLVLSSSLLMFFGTAMLTESLTSLWGALILAVTWRWQAVRGRRLLVGLAAVTVAMAFTRQAALIPAGALVVAWLGSVVLRRRDQAWGLPTLVVTTTAVVVQVMQTLVFPTFSQYHQYLAATKTDSLMAALRATPRLAWHILHTDLRNYAAADHALLVLVVLATISGVLLWRRSESHLLLGAFAVVTLLNVTNGTPTAFRYAMPGLVFWVVAIAALTERVMQSRTAAADVTEGTPAAPEAHAPG